MADIKEIVLSNVPVKEFQQYLNNRRTSLIGNYKLTPTTQTTVRIEVERTRPPQPQPRTIFRQVSRIQDLSTITSSQYLYALTLTTI